MNEQVHLLNKTLLNIYINFIPNKILTFNDSDPPWISNHIKNLINFKNQIFQSYLYNGKKSSDYDLLQTITTTISKTIIDSRSEYFHRLSVKLNNPKTSSKAYWKILKTFTNGKKIPSIPPILVNNKYVSNFSTKANIFNTFFSQQCNNVITSSVVPNTLNAISDKRISQLEFNIDDIIAIIRNLNPNKAHGHDGFSIRMIQLSCDSIAKPLHLIFKNCFQTATFPAEWKKGNIIPIHKKDSKQEVTNYRPISL